VVSAADPPRSLISVFSTGATTFDKGEERKESMKFFL
jgi:hypothetical protein